MAKKYITQDRLKKNTLADIFIFILEKKQTTRREIEAQTGFSWGTVSSNVAFLIEKGYVKEEKSEQSGVAGRTTYLLKLTSDHVASIGLDINRSGFSCEVVALDSSVIKKFSSDFTAQTQAEVLTQSETLCKTAIDWCAENGIHIFSLGIAIQGSVSGRTGISIRFPGIEDWQAYNVKEHFAEKFCLPVYLGHDPKCMLLGEMYRQKYDDCVLVRIDNGIGMAVSLDGRILDDTERFELGHILVAADGKKDNGGKQVRLETCGTLSVLEDSVAGGNKGEESLLGEAGACLSSALYNVYVLFKPEKIVLTGEATKYDCFIEGATSLLKSEDVKITIDSGISAAYGAAVESMKSAIKSYVT